MREIRSITFLGSGNLAYHLAIKFLSKGISIEEIYSRSIKNAAELAEKVDATPITKIEDLSPNSDLYIIAVNDREIESLSKQLLLQDQIIVHTSGSIHTNVLSGYKNYGVFYPLQTFTKYKEIDMSSVPICVEGNNKESESALINLGKLLSGTIQPMKSEDRKKLHLAAVFASNFTNHMYAISKDILVKNNIDFELLKPLIFETAKKIKYSSPQHAQTGPALRNDNKVINEHIEMLEGVKNYQEIYKLITKSITDK